MAKHCFKQGCELEVQYVCLCLGFETYCCELHLKTHLKLPYGTHSFDSILTEPCNWAKAEILQFLEKEKSKKEKLKKVASFSQNCQEHLNKIDFYLQEISCLIEKISKPSPEAEAKVILPDDLDLYNDVRLFCRLGQLKNERSLILSKAKNDPETEQNFRRTCLLFENNFSNSLFSQAYQEYISSYQKITSTYLIDYENRDNALNLFIYDTENEREEMKVFEIPGKLNICFQSIIQLPNHELFAHIGNHGFIIDRNFQVRKLPPQLPEGCFATIYYNRSVYCFGNKNYKNPSRRFRIEENRWEILASTPKTHQEPNNNIIFNRNILIAGNNKCNLLLYSIDIDSFSKIPYKFTKYKKKTLINTEEKLYLIEWYSYKSLIYESETMDEYTWNKIAASPIALIPKQVNYSNNKGAIYISIFNGSFREYLKFDLDQKTLTEIASYGNTLALKRLEDNLEVIECYGHTFKLDSNHAAIYINKGFTLEFITRSIEIIESENKSIEDDSTGLSAYSTKGTQLHWLGRYLEALDCYNEAIKIQPEFYCIYGSKGDTLHKLKRYIEAIEWYDK